MTEKLAETPKLQSQKSDKLFMENTLLRISGVLFCHDAKRAPTRTEEITLNKGIVEKHVVIRPDPKLGQPGPLAHKLLMAIIKKQSDYGKPIQNEVSFSQRELMRLIGRVESGNAQQQILRALREITYTRVKAFFKDEKGRYFEHDIAIFTSLLIERRESFSGTLQACSVTIADQIVKSLKEDHFTCLNHFLMLRLGTIGQALYMRLFFHFANLFEEKRQKQGLQFHKHYGDICVEWLGGLTVQKKKSLIIRDQLGTHLHQLVNVGVLSSFSIEKAKSREGFVLAFRPGKTFFEDYDRFYRHRNQGELQWDYHVDRQQIAEPLKFAYLFEARRSGLPIERISSAPSSATEAARAILEHVPIDEAEAFLTFALASAKSTNFDVQSIGGLKQYVAPYRKSREHLALARRAEIARKAKEQTEAEQIAYERFSRALAERIYKTLSDSDRAIVDAQTQVKVASYGRGSTLQRTMLDLTRTRITRQLYGNTIPSFEDWKQADQKTLLAGGDLD